MTAGTLNTCRFEAIVGLGLMSQIPNEIFPSNLWDRVSKEDAIFLQEVHHGEEKIITDKGNLINSERLDSLISFKNNSLFYYIIDHLS